jgi:hypothetical protein
MYIKLHGKGHCPKSERLRRSSIEKYIEYWENLISGNLTIFATDWCHNLAQIIILAVRHVHMYIIKWHK